MYHRKLFLKSGKKWWMCTGKLLKDHLDLQPWITMISTVQSPIKRGRLHVLLYFTREYNGVKNWKIMRTKKRRWRSWRKQWGDAPVRTTKRSLNGGPSTTDKIAEGMSMFLSGPAPTFDAFCRLLVKQSLEGIKDNVNYYRPGRRKRWQSWKVENDQQRKKWEEINHRKEDCYPWQLFF